MSVFRWTQKTELAAELVARDDLPDKQIAEQVGVTEQTLENWKRRPEFVKRVQEHLAAYRAAIRARGIAVVENRVARQNRDWERLEAIKTARAEAAYREMQARRDTALAEKADESDTNAEKPDVEEWSDAPFEEAPGMLTGLIVRQEKPTKFGTVIEFRVDTGLLAEQRALEAHVARELHQWKETVDVTMRDGGIAEALQEKLDALAKRLTSEQAKQEAEDSGPTGGAT